MAIDYSLHILLWLCSFLLTPADSTWVLQGQNGPPMALVKSAEGFQLQPPKGVDAKAEPVTIKGTKVSLGSGKYSLKADIAKLLPVSGKSTLADLPKLLCDKKQTTHCFDTVSLGVGRAQFVLVNAKGEKTTMNLKRVGD